VSLKTIAEKGLPVGFPDPNTQIAILPFSYELAAAHTQKEWENLVNKNEDAGEIVVTGDHVLQHYLNNSEAEKFHKIKVESQIWHRTGDAGRLGSDGILYFLGRCNEVISLAEEVLFPAIFTCQFCSITGIKTAALLKINEELLLVLEKDEFIEASNLSAALNVCNIPSAQIRYLKKIPKDPRHQTKIDYEKLRILLCKS